MSLGITILGSGSKGNSILIHDSEKAIMIDAGFSRKELISRINASKLSPSIIKALLITHEHEDHVRGVRIFADELQLPSYMTVETLRYMKNKGGAAALNRLFEPGTEFDAEGFKIEAFSVQHDALQPVGFVIRKDGFKIGIATDLGYINNLAKTRLAGADALILESNYDINMLRDSDRPLNIKRRIMGRHGHLDNQDAINALSELAGPKTKLICLAHISNTCNTYELVKNLAEEKLQSMGRTDILLNIAEQDNPIPTIWIS